MRQVLLFSILLVVGIVASQILPSRLGEAAQAYHLVVTFLTLVGLSFIMIHVGYEFDIDKRNLPAYGKDYLIAMTAAAFPWILVTLYFVFVMLPPTVWTDGDAWRETLLAGRFAAPTSAGVLFSMLAAAGLGATWMFHKARILAIFDDLDTVLLMLPLKALIVGLAWQLGVVLAIMIVQLWIAWHFLHRLRIPVTWPWVLAYSVLLAAASEAVYLASYQVDDTVPVHIEVLLPAFVLGCVAARTRGEHAFDTPGERRAAALVAGTFMVLVGLSMPEISGTPPPLELVGATVTAAQPQPAWGTLLGHVLALTLLSNLGKMVPALCYRREASFRERLAVAVVLWPRGEVGAGVLVVSLSYGIGGPIVTAAMLSLALNLALTGAFILIVKYLVWPPPEPGERAAVVVTEEEAKEERDAGHPGGAPGEA